MKILVTGVLGVIGSKLEEILKIRGHEVFGVDLYHTSRVYGHGLGKVKSDDYFRCDIGEFRQIEQVIEYVKPDLIYNCAAEFGRWNGENFYEKVWKSNVIGMKHIIRLQEKHGFKLVHCSSSEVYGDYEGVMYEDVLNETPIIQMNDYAMSKRVNEMQIHSSRSQFGTNSVMVRFFNTYGPGEWYHPFRSVNCLFTYQEHTIENLAELLVKYTKADASLVDYREHGEVLTTKHKHVDASKSVRDLDHKNTVSLEEGVWETVQWMKEHYRL